MKNILLILLFPLSIAATAQTKKVVVVGTRGGSIPISLTTTGTSGASTLVGSALNIPNYATGGSSGGIDSVRLAISTDSIKQFKAGVGTLAFRTQRLFNVKDYGATGDSTQDATPFIQAAINAAFLSKGGTVYFPDGFYFLSSPLDTSSAKGIPNSQLVIPDASFRDASRTHVTFEGESKPNFTISSTLVDSMTYAKTGVIIKSTIQGTGTTPAIFGVSHIPKYLPNLGGGYLDYNYNNISFQNLTLVVKSNAATTGVNMSGINGRYMGQMQVDNLVVTNDGDLKTDTIPSAITVGIVTPGSAGESLTKISNTIIKGFRNGVAVGEHVVLDQVQCFGNWFGFTFFSCDHAVYASRILSQWNRYDVYIPNEDQFNVIPRVSKFSITQLDIEQVPSSFTGKWWVNQKNILDIGNRGVGNITWNSITNLGNLVDTLSYQGAANIYLLSLRNQQILPKRLQLTRNQLINTGLIFDSYTNNAYKFASVGDGYIGYAAGQGAGNNLVIQNDGGGDLKMGVGGTSANLTLNGGDGSIYAQASGAIVATFKGTGGVANFALGGNANVNANYTLQNNGSYQWFIGNTGSNNNFRILNLNGASEIFTIQQSGNIGLNNAAPSSSAQLDITSTTSGFLCPRMTTTQQNAIPSPAEGLQIYNLTTHTMNFFNGTVWKTITTN